jgi:hypothetical protein
MTTTNEKINKKEEHSKECFILRVGSGKSERYYTDVAWVGEYFAEKYSSDNSWSIASDLIEDKKASGMSDESIIVRFKTKDEAEKALVSCLNSYYESHPKELPEGLIELVSLKLNLTEEVVSVYTLKDLKELSVNKNKRFVDFEKYLMGTLYSKENNLTEKKLKEERKGLEGYSSPEIDNLYKGWLIFNNK